MVSRILKLNEKVILFNFQVAEQIEEEKTLQTRGIEKCQEERDLSYFRRLLCNSFVVQRISHY